ncbi:hypothetical protein NH340_JMT03925 [Sarcoptes scabiei]|nr:hypothetical protein NH340_JMT03925 [Sarcoptes scabiei]
MQSFISDDLDSMDTLNGSACDSNDSSVDSVLNETIIFDCSEIEIENGRQLSSNIEDCSFRTDWSTSVDSVLSNEYHQQPKKELQKSFSNQNHKDNKFSYSATNSPYSNRKNLVSENGEIIWDSDWDWIQMYDKMLRMTGRRKIERQCGCQVKKHFDYSSDPFSVQLNYVSNNKVRKNGEQKSRNSDLLRLVKNRSNHQASNHTNNNSNNEMPNDEIDFKKISSFKRATSAPPVKRNPFLNKLPPSNSSKSSGAADEEMFMNQFEDVPRVQIFSIKDLELELNKINMICSNPNSEWEKRIECLKKFRSLLIAGATDYDEFYQSLTSLQVPFQTSVKDLRSQVVREACISIAFLSQRIGNKCDRFAEALLPTLIDSIQNSAKIMSSSAVVAIRFVIQHTHASRLIPIITYNFSSKSKEIRKACCEFLDQLLHTWPAHTLEKHVGTLQETIKKGISDADPEARALARKAFWGFADKFKVESDYLLSSLDSNKQRMLQGEQMSNWSSTNSLNKAQNYSNRPLTTSRTNSIGTNGSIESISRQCGSLMKRSAIPVPSPKINSCSPRTPIKATSAIDIDAQRRARTKANINLNQTKMMLNSVNNSLNKRNGNPIYSGGSQTHERTPRRNRVSKSQPGSRSASPSNRINCYSTPASGSALSTSASKTKRTSLTNRDQSPIRSAAHRFERKLSSTGSATTGGRSKSYLTSSDLDLRNRILHQNDEQRIENAFAMHVTPRKKFFDDQSDESETSSICSDASFANYGVRPTEDISKILENLSSSHWSDRKDGLLGLNNFLRFTDERLNTFQLKRITDIFTRMLVDPHTKAFSLFLNTLNELIHIYKTELNSWLYILMTRLFLKVGSDTLGSIQTRILKTFESIRESFPIENQFNVIMRLLSDQTQTLNAKVKIAILQYLSKLIFLMDSSDFVFKRDNNHDIQTALIKIVSWTADIKSSDLRKISQDTIVDLYNLNSSEMTLYLNGLRKTYQDAAYQIIQHKQKSRLSQSPSTSSSLMQTPFIVKNISIVNRNFFDGNENLNSADIYDSLRKTSDEIQKYSFNIDPEAFSSSNTYELINKNDGLNDHDDSNSLRNDQYGVNTLSNASLDSGISQNLTMVHDVTLVGNRTYKMLQNDHSPKINGFDALSINRTLTPPLSNGHTNDNSLLMAFTSNSINLYDFVRYLSESNNQNGDINDGDEEDIDAKITKAYEMLLDKLGEEKECYKSQVQLLRSLGLILDRSKKNLFNNFAASTLKLLINLVCQNEAKDVIKAAEDTAIRAICNFDPIESYKILQPYLIHEESSFIIIAIKILTKV